MQKNTINRERHIVYLLFKETPPRGPAIITSSNLLAAWTALSQTDVQTSILFPGEEIRELAFF